MLTIIPKNSDTRYRIKSINTSCYEITLDCDFIKFWVKDARHILRVTDSDVKYLLKEYDFSWTSEYGTVMRFTHQLINPQFENNKYHVDRT
jgi:hypothetical protein